MISVTYTNGKASVKAVIFDDNRIQLYGFKNGEVYHPLDEPNQLTRRVLENAADLEENLAALLKQFTGSATYRIEPVDFDTLLD